MNETAIWQMVVEKLSSQFTQISMSTWIKTCEPVDFDNNRLVIRVKTELHKNTISSYFASAITQCLCDLFSTTSYELIILAENDTYSKDHMPEADETLPVIPSYTFEEFIVGPSNSFAHAAAVYVSDHLGKRYNPLFIYGDSGLGKTHLLFAIGYAVKNRFPNKRVTYVNAESFVNQLVNAIKGGTTEDFHNKYRDENLLLIDDIQFIAGKRSTQEEFFYTFNAIYESGNQIVITSDRPPVEMTLLEDRLRTRFEWGLMADIQPPDLETRMAILRNKASNVDLTLTDEQISYIATRIKSNIRQLEGVIKKLSAYSDILHQKITKELIDNVITEILGADDGIPTAESIIRETAKYYSLTPDQLKGKNQSKDIAMARQVAMYLMRKLTPMAFKDIGAALGRNHTTAISSIKKVDDMVKKSSTFHSALRDIESNITNVPGTI